LSDESTAVSARIVGGFRQLISPKILSKSMFEFNTKKYIGTSFHPLKGLFGRFASSFIGHDARIAPSSTHANLSENPL
ncbi:hypothetical protein, partial [Paramuribaculum intestinale]|uniref:hypothetical protein n=1 Tax=Paramuribaculum intestinale TaxID=2094151 RepID=UPI003F68D845